MWFERFVIIVTSLHRDYLPASWGMFHPSWVDVGTFTGSIGVFFAGFLLFMRYLPVVAISEVKGIMPQADPHYREGVVAVPTVDVTVKPSPVVPSGLGIVPSPAGGE
jgi:molybdopterin-containing oxidoreductase family membrane subunit